MKYLFSALGGSGSTFLAHRFQKRGLEVAVRPDTYFVPRIINGRGNHKKNIQANHQLIDGYHVNPEKEAANEWYRRSGWRLDESKPLAGQLKRYIQWARSEPKYVVMFNYLHLGRFFSQYRIFDIITLVRHPLHNFVSLYGHQHPEKVQSMGGLDTEEAVRFFADLWRAWVYEALICRHKIIRFEFARADYKGVKNVPKEIKNLFHSWDSSKRNHGVVSADNERLLYTLVKAEYHKLYDDWGV